MVMVNKMDITPRKRSQIVTLSVYCHKTQREIAKICKVSQRAVCNILKLKKFTGFVSPKRRGRCGRKRKTSARDDRKILSESVKYPRKTSDQINQSVTLMNNVSARTIRRRLFSCGRIARRPVKKQLLTAAMMKKRLQWARQYQHWTKEM